MLDKNYFTMEELVKHPDFPIRSSVTIKKLIEKGVLKAVNVSCSKKLTKTGKPYVRYRIYRDSVINFLNSQLGENYAKKFKSKK